MASKPLRLHPKAASLIVSALATAPPSGDDADH
jgi:hypothetical protein